MRWIIAIVLSLGVAAGGYFGATLWNDYQAAQAKLVYLKVVQKDLETVRRQYDEQAGAVAKANALWSHIQQAGLDPALWVKHPLSISKTVTWEDFTHLVVLSANTFNQDGGYWFKPEKLRVVRIAGKDQGKMGVGSDAQSDKSKQMDLYDATIDGKFLIRKK